ncbi:hypothetical protein AALP_AA6G323400 [Arabis alpina]|uniref:ADP-ribosyl cyclase/cyclic ADP-ribose hydrolase n=1 Tax=Arabis alpina TaxID=50452 RepID=A0A087GT43_ARAAL|nr:hypothetical protein AALP_AA6G323400 [Arabis alpina]
MASSSSHIKRFHIFLSFHGTDVRKGFLSHLHNHFESKGITTFNDQEIERGHTIGPELVQAIRESRLAMVVLSKNYASSTWCLDELVEILKCNEASGLIVMTIFHKVDPSDVRKQWGDFGSAFEKTCKGKTEEERQRWSKALAYVATIAGEHSLNWVNEAEMIQKIAIDVTKKLNATPSMDFEGMVGMEAHLRKLSSLLYLECDDVKMIGIWGPAGIDDLEQLEVLAKEPSWFGPGSRIIVTTKDKKILNAHGIKDIYHVDFPSKEEALEILCLSAFKQSSLRDGFEELAKKVVKFCGNLPLALRVVGSSLCGESKNEWMLQLHGIETNLDRKLEDVLRVGYENLLAKHQSLFLHIACFFNYQNIDYVTTMLPDSILDVGNGLKTLAVKSLVHISNDGLIEMHCLLQQLGRQVVVQQSSEPGKRQFLVEAEEIRDVLANETGTGSVIGISADMSKIGKFSISGRAFEGMRNLKYLRLQYASVILLEDLEYLPRLRFLCWPYYPRKSLPPTFQPERLVELHMLGSNLEKLWGGIQALPNLKKIDLGFSINLIEIPNLSKATNLETLTINGCERLVEVPSSLSNLHKLKKLEAIACIKLQVVPTNINLASLEVVKMSYCSRLRSLPNLSSNIKRLNVGSTKIKEFPTSIVEHWSPSSNNSIRNSIRYNSDIKTIPDSCRKLVSIPALSPSLEFLFASSCVSLKDVCCSFHIPVKALMFHNCLKLDEETRKGIIQQSSGEIYLPGKEVPAEFTHKATGNSITISSRNFSASSSFKACLLLSRVDCYPIITCHLRSIGGVKINTIHKFIMPVCQPDSQSPSEHLFIFCDYLFNDEGKRCLEVDVTMKDIIFEFSCYGDKDRIKACGVQILEEEGESSGSSEMDYSETGGTSNHHIDGDGDGDGEYKAGAYKVSQVEHIKNSTHTRGYSLMRSSKKRLLLSRPCLWRKKKKMKMTKT